MLKWFSLAAILVAFVAAPVHAGIFDRVREALAQDEEVEAGEATPPNFAAPSPSDSIVVENDAVEGAYPSDGYVGGDSWSGSYGYPSYGSSTYGYPSYQKGSYPFVDGCANCPDPCCNGWWDGFCESRHGCHGPFKGRHFRRHAAKGCGGCDVYPGHVQHFPMQKGGFGKHGLGIHHQKGFASDSCSKCGEIAVKGGYCGACGVHRPHLGLFDWKLRHAPRHGFGKGCGCGVPTCGGCGYDSFGYGKGYDFYAPSKDYAAPDLKFDAPTYAPADEAPAAPLHTNPAPQPAPIEPLNAPMPTTSHSA